MEQEGEADQHHHRELLHQLAGEVVDGALDKVGAIVDGDDLHPSGRLLFSSASRALTPSMVCWAFSP